MDARIFYDNLAKAQSAYNQATIRLAEIGDNQFASLIEIVELNQIKKDSLDEMAHCQYAIKIIG